jgi:hypothetical protein
MRDDLELVLSRQGWVRYAGCVPQADVRERCYVVMDRRPYDGVEIGDLEPACDFIGIWKACRARKKYPPGSARPRCAFVGQSGLRYDAPLLRRRNAIPPRSSLESTSAIQERRPPAAKPQECRSLSVGWMP